MNVPPLRPAVIPLIMGLLMVGTGVGVSVVSVSMHTVEAGSGEVVNSERLVVESQRLTYTGSDVSGTVVVVNNTGGTNVSGDVSIDLKAANGSVVAQQTETGVGFASNTTTSVTVSFSSPVPPESFFWFGFTVTSA